ncbi:hypothetical protein F5Y17DRAFT_446011 [Xylariaceae sp. FL0594]|nr:hypothetical protein F5Y17DRAFT_446011 [Xylariaceae sp. FL0594]
MQPTTRDIQVVPSRESKMENAVSDRLQVELDLLFAMYPDTLTFLPKERELRFSYPDEETKPGRTPILLLRLPDSYPLRGFPEVLSAIGCFKEDLRSQTIDAFRSIEIPEGEEVLDALILSFCDLISSRKQAHEGRIDGSTRQSCPGESTGPANRTVVIWLHHLLNTNKRKLALNPFIAGAAISGITKPGYPGVMIFSGEESAVDLHVMELRNQRWQAFQIRYDDAGDFSNRGKPREVWRFKHGTGIREVESMSDVVQGILDLEKRDVFIHCIGVK